MLAPIFADFIEFKLKNYIYETLADFNPGL